MSSLGYVGGVRRIEHAFYNAAGNPADPNTIVLEIIEPGQTEQTFTWTGADTPQITRDTAKGPAGYFYTDWPMTREGTHSWKVKGTGAVAAAARGQFVVVDTPHD